MSRIAVLSFLAMSLFSLSAWANVNRVVVKDCEGMIRAAQETTPGDKLSVSILFEPVSVKNSTVSFSDGTQSFSKILTNEQHSVVFTDIGAGEWQVCDPSKSLKLSKVTFLDKLSEVGENRTSALGILGGLGVAGGAAALVAGSGGSNGDTGPLVSGGVPLSAPSAPQKGSSTQEQPTQMAAQHSDTQAAIIPDCPTNRRPDPLSPFL